MTNFEDACEQISELDALEAIYPNENEVVVKDLHTLSVLKQYVETNGSSALPTEKLHISVHLKLEEPNCTLNVECTLPLTYPTSSSPNIFLRCDDVSRSMQQKLNSDLATFMESIEVGETCLYQIIQWGSDNVGNYLSPEKDKEAYLNLPESESETCVFTRLWIYSHHIYNKEKRKCILEWAKELDLTGFSMPGKPGVVCVEGIQDHCEDYWQRLRRQTWKRLSVVHKEELSVSLENLNEYRKFKNVLCEMNFGVHGGRDYHMDLGQFLHYLTEHKCEYMFSILFGVEGKSSKT